MTQVSSPTPGLGSHLGSPVTQRVGFGPRLGAALLDAVIMIPIIFLAVPAFVVMEQQGRLTPAVAYVLIIGLSLVGIAYSAFEIFKAATPGKMILKLRIASEDGTPADTGKLTARWLYKQGGNLLGLLATITTIKAIGVIGNLWGLVIAIGCFFVLGQARQAFHDKWAKTAVFNKEVLQTTGFQPIMGQQVVQPVQPQ
jgi:uncharacterized RDD family membrane protein YckC